MDVEEQFSNIMKEEATDKPGSVNDFESENVKKEAMMEPITSIFVNEEVVESDTNMISYIDGGYDQNGAERDPIDVENACSSNRASEGSLYKTVAEKDPKVRMRKQVLKPRIRLIVSKFNRPYACQCCGKIYAHHFEQIQFICTVCDEQFGDCLTVARHVRSFHLCHEDSCMGKILEKAVCDGIVKKFRESTEHMITTVFVHEKGDDSDMMMHIDEDHNNNNNTSEKDPIDVEVHYPAYSARSEDREDKDNTTALQVRSICTDGVVKKPAKAIVTTVVDGHVPTLHSNTIIPYLEEEQENSTRKEPSDVEVNFPCIRTQYQKGLPKGSGRKQLLMTGNRSATRKRKMTGPLEDHNYHRRCPVEKQVKCHSCGRIFEGTASFRKHHAYAHAKRIIKAHFILQM